MKKYKIKNNKVSFFIKKKMPCNSDYMEPNSYEIEHAKVQALLEELDNGILEINRDLNLSPRLI